jgi:deazaflavin-dependent oxidoreductase (nitroreductase family)
MVGMQLPQWLARFNRYFTNPIQRLWAGWAPGMGILEHAGRKSGKQYRTPLNVFPTEDGVVIVLTYGPDRDWLKNITAAGRAHIKSHGKTSEFVDPVVVPKAGAAQSVTGLWRPVVTRLPFEQAVVLKRA